MASRKARSAVAASSGSRSEPASERAASAEVRACSSASGVNPLAPPGSSASAIRSRYTPERIEPVIATPSVPPTCRVTLLTADPAPASRGGTPLIITAVTGVPTRPIPKPCTHSSAATVRTGVRPSNHR